MIGAEEEILIWCFVNIIINRTPYTADIVSSQSERNFFSSEYSDVPRFYLFVDILFCLRAYIAS